MILYYNPSFLHPTLLPYSFPLPLPPDLHLCLVPSSVPPSHILPHSLSLLTFLSLSSLPLSLPPFLTPPICPVFSQRQHA